MTEFYVGQKVVCIDDAPAPKFFIVPGSNQFTVKKGCIYTISWLGNGWNSCIGQFPALSLVGATAGTQGILQKWHQRRFKPIETKNIEIFRQIAQDVTDGKVKEMADG